MQLALFETVLVFSESEWTFYFESFSVTWEGFKFYFKKGFKRNKQDKTGAFFAGKFRDKSVCNSSLGLKIIFTSLIQRTMYKKFQLGIELKTACFGILEIQWQSE